MSDVRNGESVIHVPRHFVTEVRDLIGDNPEENELVDGQSWSDEKLALFIVDVINDYNLATPEVPQKMTMEGLLRGVYASVRHHVIDAAVGRALKYEAIRRMRNAVPYQAGSINFDPNSVWVALKQEGDQKWAEWQQWRDRKKIEVNVGNGFGGGSGGGYSVAHSDLLTRTAYDQGNVVTVVGTLI